MAASGFLQGERSWGYLDFPSRGWAQRALGAAAMMGSARVLAADTSAPASSGELAEITVTAEKRSETQQNVPLSMTTFSSVALQEKQINTFFDYATKVPNLAFAPTGDGVEHLPHDLDPWHLRRQRHGLLHRRHTATRLARSAGPRPRPHRSAARTAGHLVRRTLDGRLGAPRDQGAEPDHFRRDGARRSLLHRTHQPAELDRPMVCSTCRSFRTRLRCG